MSSFGDDARDGITPTLIQSKLHRPRLGQDLILRPHLIQRLNQGVDRRFSLISAQAGAGKSTLLAQWLQEYPQRCAWLSLVSPRIVRVLKYMNVPTAGRGWKTRPEVVLFNKVGF